MMHNYIKIALRNLFKNKVFSLVNVLGLALGMAVSMLIVLYVAHEYSYDKFHIKGKNVVQAVGLSKFGDTDITFINFSDNFAPLMKENNAEVQDYARIISGFLGNKLIQTDPEHKFEEPDFIFADPGFFRLFSFKILKGSPQEALNKPFTVFLSESMAKKYFGNANPIGKTLLYDKKHTFEIVGIVQDAPFNSTIQYNFIGSLPTYTAMMRLDYPERYNDKPQKYIGMGDCETWFLLDQSTSKASIQARIPSLGLFDPNSPHGNPTIQFDFLQDIHFKSSARKTPVAKLTFIFSQIALLILLLAITNYMNLTTARATARAKEVGLRKVIGAKRSALAKQFYIESAVVTVLAFLLGFGFFQILRPIFYEVLDLKIDESFLQNPYFLLPLLSVLFVSILLAGSYPALLLSRFAPIETLQGKLSQGKGSATIRKGLTVFQFTVSTGLIICTLVIYSQLNFMKNHNLSAMRNRIVAIDLENIQDGQNSNGIIRQKIAILNEVEAITATSYELYGNGMSLYNVPMPGKQAPLLVQTFPVDEHFFNTLQLDWKVKPQHDFPCNNCVIINEATAQKLDINEKNVGKEIDLNDTKARIAGIVKNFHLSSVKYEIQPLLMEVGRDTAQNYGMLYVKLASTADLSKSIAAMEKIYNQYRIEKPFEYYFLDEALDKLYKEETRFGKMLSAFTGFSLFIACLGLFGLVTYTAETRTKEIGIRKVLGASVQQIVGLLSKDFIKVVVIALLFAFPLAGWAMSNWLQDFAYRIDIQWWMFALAGITAVGIALLTVSFQAIRAAVANPVKSLRSE